MEWLERVARMRRWTRGGERDPHRAVQLLFGLGYFPRHQGLQPMYVRDVEEPCGTLPAEFGPPKPTSAGYPFHQLAKQVFQSPARFS